MNNKKSLKISVIGSKIHSIRGLQVILDKDLAYFYGVKPIRLREQVKRNKKRFPEDFMFQLEKEEVDFMVSQNAIPSRKHLGGALPYVFTEQGVAALSSVLKSDQAIAVNIQIIRAFVAMRHFILANAQVFQRLDTLEIKQIHTDKKIDRVLNAMAKERVLPKQGIFFEGQFFDAHQFVCKLIRSAKKSNILIDNYVDDTVLTLFLKRKKNVKFTIFTKDISKQFALDIKKFNKQYPAVSLNIFTKSHDRFLIIDDTVYHFGSSLKDLGKHWFAFSKMEIGTMKMLAKLKAQINKKDHYEQ